MKERAVIIRHAIKNALIPITLIGLQLPILVGGAMIMENIFNLPGLEEGVRLAYWYFYRFIRKKGDRFIL